MIDLLKSRIYFQRYIQAVFILLLMVVGNYSFGQATSTSLFNLPQGSNPNFLGWDATVNTDVSIRHLTDDQPIIFKTNGQERMRILPDANRSVLIEAQAADNAKLRITQDRGYSAIDGILENFDYNDMNRGLKVGLALISPTNTVIGVNTSAIGNTNSSDVALHAAAFNSRTNYGIYGESSGPDYQPNYPLGNWAGVFTDDVIVTGSTYGGSDATLKEDINQIEDACDKILQLRPVSFRFIEDSGINLSAGLQYGLIAQEVQEVIPSIVSPVIVPKYTESEEQTETLEHLALSEIELIPILVQAVKDHSELISESENRIEALQEILDQHFSTNLNNQEDETE